MKAASSMPPKPLGPPPQRGGGQQDAQQQPFAGPPSPLYASGYGPPPPGGYAVSYGPPPPGYAAGYGPPPPGYAAGYGPPPPAPFPSYQAKPVPPYGSVAPAMAPPPMVVVVDGGGGGGYPGAAGAGYSGAGSKYIADADASVRRGFITKVYGILSVQLLITLAFVLAFSYQRGLRDAIIAAPGVLPAAIILSLVFLFALSCFPSVARSYPGNYLCLLGFTLCESLMVGTIASTYAPDTVVKAVVATAVITAGLTLFAFQTRIDFTAMSSSLFCVLLLLLMFGIWTALFPSQVAQTAYAALGAVVFSLFICYDTQLIIGGKHHTHQFAIDDYCFAVRARPPPLLLPSLGTTRSPPRAQKTPPPHPTPYTRRR